MAQRHPGTVLITGAAKRIGAALAADLAAGGWRAAIHFHTSEKQALEVVADIEKAGGTATALQADLGDARETADLMQQASNALGPINCLINNASIFQNDSINDVTIDSWERHQAVNLRAPMLLTRAFAEQALTTGQDYNVINLLDQRVLKPTPGFLSYTISKTGLWTLTQTLAIALAPGIRVNAIGPGPTLPSSRQSAEQFEAQCAKTPLGRGPTIDEICATARFILETPSLTGQMIVLDGGQHLGRNDPGGSHEIE